MLLKSLLLSFFSYSLFAVNVADELKIYYFDREPLYIPQKVGSLPKGIVVDELEKILNNSSFKYRYVQLPPKRQLSVLKESGNHCGLGWFKNSSREQDYKFSYSIFFDGEMYLLGNSLQKNQNFKSLNEILVDSSAKILLNSEFSFGDILDSILKTSKNVQTINGKQSNIVKMVDRNRGHFTIVSKEEKNYIEKEKIASNIYFIKLEGVSNFSPRYLMCSKGINPQLFNSLNGAILNYYKNQTLKLVD